MLQKLQSSYLYFEKWNGHVEMIYDSAPWNHGPISSQEDTALYKGSPVNFKRIWLVTGPPFSKIVI